MLPASSQFEPLPLQHCSSGLPDESPFPDQAPTLSAIPGDPRNEGSIPLFSIAFMVRGAEIVHRGP